MPTPSSTVFHQPLNDCGADPGRNPGVQPTTGSLQCPDGWKLNSNQTGLPNEKLIKNLEVVKSRLNRPMTLPEKMLIFHQDDPTSKAEAQQDSDSHTGVHHVWAAKGEERLTGQGKLHILRPLSQ